MKNNFFDYVVLFIVTVLLAFGIMVAFTGCSHFKIGAEKLDIDVSKMEVVDGR